jgi:hypothetical protein
VPPLIGQTSNGNARKQVPAEQRLATKYLRGIQEP